MVFKVLLDPQDLEFKTLSQYLGITGSFYIIILCMWDEELHTFREKKKNSNNRKVLYTYIRK